ncbi:MAG: HAMP domain-containing protein [Candidatus Omnitrophica bacterium]|nr:HAMP domain-containing protein [Candidatus Omnitrophota bacterium]
MAELPTPKRALKRVLRVWIIGLLCFGYGPAFTYGFFIWLLNEQQWAWTYFMYTTLVPLVGGFCVLVLPWRSYHPIHHTLTRWANGEPVEAERVRMVYEQALRLPWQVAMGCLAASAIGYLVGTGVVHWKAHQPITEILKTLPAIPLVGGMMGAFCYFGTMRALHPIVAWCSRRLTQAPAVRALPIAVQFLTTTYVLAIAILCLMLPATYTLGQMITERHVQDRALMHLRSTLQAMPRDQSLDDRVARLPDAALGTHGYVFAAAPDGRLVGHPKGYRTLAQEGFYRVHERLQAAEGVWVDRVGRHRVVAFARLRLGEMPVTVISVAFPTDFAEPLGHFFLLSGLIVIEVLIAVMVFGRYYTKGITTPLAELTSTAERIAQHGDLALRVPVTTNDELSDLARSFNRMVEELETSKANLEHYTRRLEQSTQELSVLNQEMEDLLRVVSHDLRAPLINVQGFSKRLEPLMQETVQALDRIAAETSSNGLRVEVTTLKGDLQTRFAESLRFIAKGVEKMDTLLASLLAISRVGRKADPIQPQDLAAILDDVLATFHHQLEERAIRVIRHPLPQGVPCRRNEMNQAFSNLLSNAINFMGPSEHRCIEIGATTREQEVECFIRDTGIGIGPDDQERIFNMFTRLQAVDVPGEGIGLAYVKKIIRSHGGRVWVTSTKGQGSTFFFTLPTAHTVATRG